MLFGNEMTGEEEDALGRHEHGPESRRSCDGRRAIGPRRHRVRDLASRTAEQINGPKGLWAAIIAISWVGPIAYFIKGRREGT